MPRGKLVPITTVIQAVSTISNESASIAELVDALNQCYDCDAWMMYRGTGCGLAEAIDGNPLDEYGGYNNRRNITTELFNCRYWSDPAAIIRRYWQEFEPDEFLMTRADAILLGYALWEFFESDTFDVDWFDELTKTQRKPSPTVESSALQNPPSDVLDPPGRWSWGNHHTELLGHLEAAAREFWGGYNPHNAKATAPKNETVIAWLEARDVPGQRKKVSKQMAESIATMLRPDGLPTGPRK